jgi:hypothetical protein
VLYRAKHQLEGLDLAHPDAFAARRVVERMPPLPQKR